MWPFKKKPIVSTTLKRCREVLNLVDNCKAEGRAALEAAEFNARHFDDHITIHPSATNFWIHVKDGGQAASMFVTDKQMRALGEYAIGLLGSTVDTSEAEKVETCESS